MKEKGLCTVILLFLFFSNAIQAGQISGKGLKAGINLAKSSGVVNPKFKTGFVGGGFLRYKLSKAFSIQPELLFSMKGYNVDEDFLTVDARFSYLELPVLAKLTLLNHVPLKPEFYVGPALGYNLTNEFESRFSSNGPVVASGDITGFNDFDLGLVFGGNFSFELGSGQMLLDFRFNLGLRDWESQLGGSKNRAISIMAGYSL